MDRKRLVMTVFMYWSWGVFASVVAAAEPNSLSIKDLIFRVQQELIESQTERTKSGREPLFEVETLTIEINFVVTTTTDAKGGIDLKLVTVEGGKQYENQQVQKITLQLTAIPSREGFRPKSNHTTVGHSRVPSLPKSPLPPFVKGDLSPQIMWTNLVWSDLDREEGNRRPQPEIGGEPS